MAQSGFTPILLYASNTATSLPSAGNLTNSANGAELAVNTADKRLFTKDSGGSVVELGTNPSALTVAGTTTLSALTASTALALNASKAVVSVTNTGTGNNVLSASPTLTGTIGAAALTLSSDLTLSGGTANGVLYLNGSKVATSGSALTFDGTNFATTGNANLGSGSKSTDTQLNFASDLGTQRIYLDRGTRSLVFYDATTAIENYRIAGITGIQTWGVGGSEQMRLTSTGLGIGTSSPGAKLEVNVPGTTGTSSALRLSRGIGYGTTDFKQYYTSGTDYGLTIGNTVSDYLTLNLASGNLGLGVTPSAWGSGKAFEIGSGGNGIWSGSGYTSLLQNTAFTSGAYRYVTSQTAARLDIEGSAFKWYTAPSGTAGNAISFTQAMTLTAAGNLLLGSTTAPTGFARVSLVGGESSGSGANSGIQLTYNASTFGGGAITTVNAAGGGLSFYTFTGNVGSESYTERARITSGGDLLVGTTSSTQNADIGLKFLPGGAVYVVNNGGTDGFSYYNTTAAAYRFYVQANGTIAATNTTIAAISDQRLKENVQDLDVGLDKIMALKPRKFDWKAGKGKDIKGDRGWIAQEFEQVFPDMVDQWKDPAPEGEEPYKSVRADLIPVLVKAIQEQQALIQTLTARVAALEA